MGIDVNKHAMQRALQKADTYGVDMSLPDWAQTIGVMNTCGHGYIWDMPKNEDNWIDDAKLVEMIERAAKDIAEGE